MLRKSFRFFYVVAILCVGCAHKAAMYQKAVGLSEGEKWAGPYPCLSKRARPLESARVVELETQTRSLRRRVS